MKPWFACLLVLLLAGAALDDAWAAATPGSSDDSLAAQNDSYLVSAGQDGAKAWADGPEFLPGSLAIPDVRPPVLLALLRPECRAHAPAGRPLYSLLMTLRC